MWNEKCYLKNLYYNVISFQKYVNKSYCNFIECIPFSVMVHMKQHLYKYDPGYL